MGRKWTIAYALAAAVILGFGAMRYAGRERKFCPMEKGRAQTGQLPPGHPDIGQMLPPGHPDIGSPERVSAPPLNEASLAKGNVGDCPYLAKAAHAENSKEEQKPDFNAVEDFINGSRKKGRSL